MQSMRRLFGTDGIRGVAGEPPLDGHTLYRLGRALTDRLRREGGPGGDEPVIGLGRDTRESCPEIVASLTQGILAESGRAVDAGILPTPGLALLTRREGFAAGIMISASHNPYHDNGVKVFDHRGMKLPDQVEAELEGMMDGVDGEPEYKPYPEDLREELHEHYLEFLDTARNGVRLDGTKVVLDCAHGAAFRLGPEAFRRAGAEVLVIGNEPDGRNINDGVGSLHPDQLAVAVRDAGADLGFCFDGDADRCLAATRSGTVLDGDFILGYCGRALDAAGRLPGHTVVATVMSNLGLERFLERHDIALVRTKVGDRYVLESMLEGGYALGGEQSGHVIFQDVAPTGDGIATGLRLATLWKSGAGELDQTQAEMPRYPQVLVNVKVREKPEIEDHPVLGEAVRAAVDEMGGDGRVVVRYSGTEPKARVMIEGPEEILVRRMADELAARFRTEIGLDPDGP
jgi:phosphoglucosamine mutase